MFKVSESTVVKRMANLKLQSRQNNTGLMHYILVQKMTFEVIRNRRNKEEDGGMDIYF